MTNYKTREDMINRMSGALLDEHIKIQNKHTIAEMRDFGRYEGEGRAEGISNNDDYCFSAMIAITASYQSGKGGANWAEEHIGTRGDRAMMMPQSPMVWGLYDVYSRLIEQRPTEDECKKLLASLEEKHKIKLPWTVRGIPVTKANTIWSPIFDSHDSPEARLHNEYDVEPKRISPDLVHAFQELNRKGGRTAGEIGEFVGQSSDGDDE
jgi:hypothetical protein